MYKAMDLFERCIVVALIIMMMIAILFGTVELAGIMIKRLASPPILLLNIEELLDVFGFFFMILIGLELLETIKTYLTKDQIHVEVVLLVAMIAVARKVIILDVKHIPGWMLPGIASVIVALGVGYFLVKRARPTRARRGAPPPDGTP